MNSNDELRQTPAWLVGAGLRRRVLGYSLAVVVSVLTLAVRLGAAEWFGDRPVLVVFILPVIIAAYFGGLGPGLLATGVVGLGSNYYLVPPVHTFAIGRSVDTVQWLTLIIVGVLISVLIESLHVAQAKTSVTDGTGTSARTERKVKVGFGVALVFLVAIGAASIFSVGRLREDMGWATHTEEVISSLRLLLSTVTDAETAERGYLITGNESDLGPYEPDHRSVDAELGRLRTLTTDNSVQQAQLDRLVPLIGHRLGIVDRVIGLRHRQDLAAAQAVVTSGEGRLVHNQIRALLAEMEATEQGLLRERSDRAAAAALVSRSVIIGGGTLAFIFVAVALFIMSQELAVRRRAEAGLSEARAELEARVRERTRELEQTNRALRESEELFAKAFRLSPEYIAIVRLADRTVVRANEALCRLWGTTEDDVVGKPTADYSNWVSEEQRVEIMQTLAADGELRNFETALRLADGRRVQFMVSTRLITLGGETCMLSVMSDITERQRAHSALAHLAAIVEYSDDAIIGKDLEGTVTSWNDGAETIFGYTAAEMIGQPIFRLIPPDRQQEETEILGRVRQGESIRHFDTLRQRKDGRLLNISVTVSAIRDTAGRVVGASKVARDVTEQKKAQQALRDTNERFASMFNSSPVATSLTTIPEGKYLDVNEAFLALFEASREEVVGRNVFELNMWADLGQRAELLTQLKEHGVVHGFDMTLRTRSGRLVQLLWSGVQVVIDGQACLLGSGLDFTERRRIEQALREKDALLHATDRRLAEMVQGMSEACITLDREWRFTFVNDRCETLLRCHRAEVIGRSIWEVFPQLVGAPAEQHYRRVMAERIPAADEAFSPVAERWLDTRLFPTPDGLAAFMMDISARKEAELAILKSQEDIRQLNASLERRVAERTAELSDLYNNAPCGYHSLDANGRFVGINDTELNWLGYEREEIIGTKEVTELLTPRSVETFRQNYPAFRATGRLENLEMEMIRKDGSILTVLLSATSVVDQTGRYLRSRSTIIDYTERKRVDNALQASREELEATNKELEAFSYSVSHDLRTPLRAVDGFSQAVLEDYQALLPAEGQRYLQTIRDSAQRMGELIDDLLRFSRLGRQPLNAQVVDMEQLVRSTLADLRVQPSGPEVQITIGKMPPGQGDPALLKQVWVNLLSNALKYSRRRNPAQIEIGCEVDAGFPVFHVRDNGAGFDMQYVHKLFGVFQRLHRAEEYEGTGVGLAIVQRIVHRHGGRVWAEAAPGRGATFFFTLGNASIP